MNTQVCVNCLNKKPVNQTDNRLVTESCGHVKCMDCLLREKSGCVACLRKNSQDFADELASDVHKLDSSILQPDIVIREGSNKMRSIALQNLIKRKKPETSHIRIETDGDGKCYFCTVCHKRFHARSQVAYHAYCNGQLKPYQCPECNKSFATHSHFKYHMRVHRNERTYSCDVCGDSFFQMSKLQRHKLKHTKEKKYVCGECNKAFNNVTSLRKHGLTHTEERPYTCTACGRRFRDGSNLRKHIAKHEIAEGVVGTAGETAGAALRAAPRAAVRRPHQCPRCPQAFHSNKDMRRHAAVHTDSKPFRCKVCNRRFRRKDNLERHIRNTHPDYVPAAAVDCDHSALRLASAADEKSKLESLNPLPPLSKEAIQKHLEVNENVSQNNQERSKLVDKDVIDKSFILEANNARQSVIVGKCTDRRVYGNEESEYIHKIRKANSKVSNALPPINEEKMRDLIKKTNLNNLDLGDPPTDVELYKKILYEKSEVEVSAGPEEGRGRGAAPDVPVHWRRKMKISTDYH